LVLPKRFSSSSLRESIPRMITFGRGSAAVTTSADLEILANPATKATTRMDATANDVRGAQGAIPSRSRIIARPASTSTTVASIITP
jgi:hypothetical protein